MSMTLTADTFTAADDETALLDPGPPPDEFNAWTNAVAASLLARWRGTSPKGVLRNVPGTSWVGAIALTTGVIDDSSRKAFTNGQCHALALAVHERTGWPLMIVALDYCVEDWDSCVWEIDGLCSCQTYHVVVRDDAGRVWDINGPQDPATLLASYGEDVSLRWLAGDVLEHIAAHDPTWRRPNLRVARSFVDVLFDTHR